MDKLTAIRTLGTGTAALEGPPSATGAWASIPRGVRRWSRTTPSCSSAAPTSAGSPSFDVSAAALSPPFARAEFPWAGHSLSARTWTGELRPQIPPSIDLAFALVSDTVTRAPSGGVGFLPPQKPW